MMNIILFDSPVVRLNLLPLTFTRPVAALRCGILTIAEKWEKRIGATVSFQTEEYLAEKFPTNSAAESLFINGSILPDAPLIHAIESLNTGQALVQDGELLAIKTSSTDTKDWSTAEQVGYSGADRITHVWDLFRKNGAQIRADFSLLTAERTSRPMSDPHTRVYHPENIFIEEGAVVMAATLNATDGPIYISRDSVIAEGSLVRGPFSIGERSQLAMGTIIRGDTTVGPGCKVGGEIGNAVFLEHSNKAHDGYLGNAVIGAWCNLGAGTTASNLTNSFGEARLWNYATSRFERTGSPFCGLVMGDNTTTAIGTLFNTATSVGTGSRIFGAGFPRTFIPPFSRGGSSGFDVLDPKTIIQFAEQMMSRRGVNMTDTDKNILLALHARLPELRKLSPRNN
ncbi:MAG: putative sugar nucleotidyl transferase [Bacteroidota bacterium]